MRDLRSLFHMPDWLWYKLPKPRGRLGIWLLGYRGYVGGLWEEAGEAQLEFLRAAGLKPHHYYLDIACGSLRGGTKLIPYLEPDHYMGIDQEEALIHLGIQNELGWDLYREKYPSFMVSDSFEFHHFQHRPDFAGAFSLFTHLPADQVRDCLSKLHSCIRENGVFLASFSECDAPQSNPGNPQPHRGFHYTRQQMIEFGLQTGWIGEIAGILAPGTAQAVIRYQPY